MADKVIIDVEARFHDSMAPGIDRAIAKAEKLERAAGRVASAMEKLDKLNKNASFEIKDKASAILDKIAEKLKKLLGQKRWDFLIGLKDKASAGLQKIADKLKKILGQKKWDFLVGLKDKASAALQKIFNKIRSINKEKIAIRIDMAMNAMKRVMDLSAKLNALTKNAWSIAIGMKDKATRGLMKIHGVAKALVATPFRVTVSLLDKVTAPIRKIKGALSSVAGLVGVGLSAAGIAQTVGMYANREDLMAQFKVLLGSSNAADQRIAELTTFAGQTPFTRDQIFQASKVLETYTEGALSTPDAPGGLRMIGDIAAATGRDYNSVATYMARLYNEIKRGGSSLGEPLMYLREMGAVSATAEKNIEKIAAGSGTVEEKWKKIADEFSRFDGMMLEMSDQMNNLMLGVKSFISNNFLMKIGEGISSQLKPFLIDFRTWRNENGDLISSWAASTKEFAALLSGKVLGTIRAIASNSFELFSSDDFKAASAAGKIGMIWDNVIAKPLSEWWSGRGKGVFESKARDMGSFLGEGLTKGLKGIFSGDFHTVLTSIFPTIGTFLQGFFANFDGPEILDALRNFVDNIPKAFENLKMKWDEYIGEPLKAWWYSSGRQTVNELASSLGDWLGAGITKGVQFLSDGILSFLGFKDTNGALGDIGEIGRSFWDSFTDSFDASKITKAIVDAISGVWAALPAWAKLLIGGYGLSKVAGALGPLANLAGGAMKVGGKITTGMGNVWAGFSGAAKGLPTVAGQALPWGVSLGSSIFNAGTKAYTLLGGAGLTGGTAALAGLTGVAGGITAAYGLYDATTDFYGAYKAHKVGDKATRDANITTGASKVGGIAGGAAIGAAIGSVVPGLGTAVGGLIGAGLGYIGGKFFGDKMARSAKAANYESQEMKEAIKDSSKSAEELAYEFEQASEKVNAKAFGDMALSMEDINEISKSLVHGDRLEAFEAMATAANQATNSLKAYKTAVADVKKWNWKAGLGVKFTTETKQQFLDSVDNFITTANQALEDSHYEAKCSVDYFFEEGEMHDQVMETIDGVYADLQAELDTAETELKSAYEVALEDGTVTADEQDLINKCLEEIDRVMQQIENAEHAAQIDLLKLKFSAVELDVDSFNTLLETTFATVQADLDTAEAQYVRTRAQLEVALESAETDEEKSKIQAQIDALNASFTEMVNSAFSDPLTVALNTIAEAHLVDLGIVDGPERLAALLNSALNTGESPAELTLNDIKVKLGDPNMSNETADEVQEYLALLYDYIKAAFPEESNMEGFQITLNPDMKLGGDLATEAQEAVNNTPIGPVKKDGVTVDLNPTPTINDPAAFTDNARNTILSSFGSGPIISTPLGLPVPLAPKYNFTTPPAAAFQASVPGNLTASTKGTIKVASEYNRDPEEMSIPDGTLNTSTAADVGVKIHYYTASSNLTSYKASLANFSGTTNNSTQRGSTNRKAAGGFVNGMQLSWVGEEGPEAIIPLVKSRRSRALDLWQETGRRLGVLENANGGIYGTDTPISSTSSDSSDESFFVSSSGGSGVVAPSGGDNKIDVNVGGITIQVNASDGNVVNAIKENIDEITEEVAGVLKNALAAQFKNMPARS